MADETTSHNAGDFDGDVMKEFFSGGMISCIFCFPIYLFVGPKMDTEDKMLYLILFITFIAGGIGSIVGEIRRKE